MTKKTCIHHSDASVATLSDDALVSLGRGRSFRICLLAAGPYSLPNAAIIPQASVIQAAHYPAQQKPEIELSFDDIIMVEGVGHHKLVRTSNPDWPILVPMFGPRYYVEFHGADDHAIHDRMDDGKRVRPDDEIRLALDLGYSPRTQTEALAACGMMNLNDDRQNPDRPIDY